MSFHREPHQLFGRRLLWIRSTKGDRVPIQLVLPITRNAAGEYRVMVEGETEPRWVADVAIAIDGQYRLNVGERT